MKRLLATVCLGLTLTFALAVRADDATEARLEYELGAEQYKQGRYTEAIQHFVASYRRVPNANIALNIVQTFEFLKRYEEAYNWNETLIETATSTERQKAVERRGQLGSKVAVLVVTTDPPRAELFVDRMELGGMGQAPRRLAVAAGKHRVIARTAGHDDASLEVEGTVGSETPAHLTLTAEMGRVSISVEPPGATVELQGEGRTLGRAPLSFELPVGEHTLSVAATGYVAQTRQVRVTRGGLVRVAVRLERAASEVSVLSVRGNVQSAHVSLDGQHIGLTPLLRDDVAPGTRTVSVSASGFQSWRGNVLLEPGGATRVSVELQPPDSGPWTGWRWIGYGSSGALLTAGGIVALSAVSARRDFDREPTADGLDRVNTRNTTADVLFALGAVALGATLTWEILKSPPKTSTGRVEVQR